MRQTRRLLVRMATRSGKCVAPGFGLIGAFDPMLGRPVAHLYPFLGQNLVRTITRRWAFRHRSTASFEGILAAGDQPSYAYRLIGKAGGSGDRTCRNSEDPSRCGPTARSETRCRQTLEFRPSSMAQ